MYPGAIHGPVWVIEIHCKFSVVAQKHHYCPQTSPIPSQFSLDSFCNFSTLAYSYLFTTSLSRIYLLLLTSPLFFHYLISHFSASPICHLYPLYLILFFPLRKLSRQVLAYKQNSEEKINSYHKPELYGGLTCKSLLTSPVGLSCRNLRIQNSQLCARNMVSHPVWNA